MLQPQGDACQEIVKRACNDRSYCRSSYMARQSSDNGWLPGARAKNSTENFSPFQVHQFPSNQRAISARLPGPYPWLPKKQDHSPLKTPLRAQNHQHILQTPRGPKSHH
ncbi:hypothetical protein QAD02_020425 [Eretmocerus hayati]|uniref:Uncharacterized protein n=1 Tax=Eretmocerus hayati TaxID=131215 RepID=A0ACC2PMG1_9HYME|nr:hypothetical protein QAD02_020425 [Eretmocerus hayati]